MKYVREADAQGKKELSQPAPVSTTQKILGPEPSVAEPKENSTVGSAELTGTGRGDFGFPAETLTRMKVPRPVEVPAPPLGGGGGGLGRAFPGS